MLGTEPVRKHHVGSVRFQRWLPFKIVAVCAVFALVGYHGLMSESLSFPVGMLYGGDLVAEPAGPTAAHLELARQAGLLRPLAEIMDEQDSVKVWNEEALSRLESCALPGAGCEVNWDKLAVLNSWHFVNSKNGGVSGEDIWANSTIEALEYSGYTLLYAVKPENVLTIYLHLGVYIQAVIWEGAELQSCIDDDDMPAVAFQYDSNAPLAMGEPDHSMPIRCMRRPESPQGIPIWKSFVLHFWGDAQSPLGGEWTLAPYDYNKWNKDSHNFYLGYSIENRCRGFKPTLTAEYDQAILLGKHEEYFVREDMPWKTLLGPVAQAVSEAEHTNFTFTAAMKKDGWGFNEDRVEQIGTLSQQGYMDVIASSIAMLGVGVPYLSPSPYEALCLGTPFINPVHKWKADDPWDRSEWETQHDALLVLDAPYVYHVHAGNATGLAHALGEAKRNPIPSFVPEDMTFSALVERHKRIMENDWHWLAEDIVLDMDQGEFEFLL